MSPRRIKTSTTRQEKQMHAPKHLDPTMIGIMFYLSGDKTLSPKDLTALIGRSPGHVRRSLSTLRARGYVKAIDGNNCLLPSGFRFLEGYFA